MQRQNIVDLILLVKKNLEVAQETAISSRNAALLISENAAASPSASGDREHAKNAAILNEQKVNQMKLFLQELEEAVNHPIPDTIQPVCHFEVKFLDNSFRRFIIVNNPIYLEGVNIISPNSPIGHAVLNKKVGDTFSYQVSDVPISGVISEVI